MTNSQSLTDKIKRRAEFDAGLIAEVAPRWGQFNAEQPPGERFCYCVGFGDGARHEHNEFQWLVELLCEATQTLETLRVAVNDKVKDPGATAFIDRCLAKIEQAVERE